VTARSELRERPISPGLAATLTPPRKVDSNAKKSATTSPGRLPVKARPRVETV
jgi:hypothetical protein